MSQTCDKWSLQFPEVQCVVLKLPVLTITQDYTKQQILTDDKLEVDKVPRIFARFSCEKDFYDIWDI